MRLSDFCSSHDVDRAIAVTVDSFVGSQKVSCKKALARAFAKYVLLPTPLLVQSARRVSTMLTEFFNRYTLKRPETQRRNRRGGGVRGGTGAA